MHEMALMGSIMSAVEAAAGEQGIKQIHRIRVVVGAERVVLPDALLFAFDLLKREPFAPDAVLQIEERPGRDFFIDYFEGE